VKWPPKFTPARVPWMILDRYIRSPRVTILGFARTGSTFAGNWEKSFPGTGSAAPAGVAPEAKTWQDAISAAAFKAPMPFFQPVSIAILSIPRGEDNRNGRSRNAI
jgi:hypothetical protein